MRDTIYALATAPGRAAVAIVRVSGPSSHSMLTALCGSVPLARKAALRKIRDALGEVLDEGVVLWFPTPSSFTGEDVFELQVHGGFAVIEAITHAIDALGGRLAEPGEFTRRAFESGRMDLAQAEAVADLVDAETNAQRQQALRQLGGELFQRGERWRETLLNALALLNAQIDFPDEDVPENVAARAFDPIRALTAEIEQTLAEVRGERVRDGLRIALIGAPNAGKSSLFNALVKREAAIVSATAGTTRDVIEAPLTLAGYKVVLADMAGIREAINDIEVEGVRRALSWAEGADLRLWTVDPCEGVFDPQFLALIKTDDIVLLTKSDLHSTQLLNLPVVKKTIRVNVVEKDGLDALYAELMHWVTTYLAGSDFPAVTRIRHRRLLEEAHAHLLRALNHGADRAEVVAADLGMAMRALESIAGHMDTEAILDRVFGSFCIGK